MVTLFFRPWWPSYGPNRDKTRNGTVLGQGASNAEDRKSLRLVVAELQRGCKIHIPYLERYSQGRGNYFEVGGGGQISPGVQTGMRSRDIFGRLRLRLRGSIPAPAPTPSKTVGQLRLRLRAKCTGSGGSGSDDQILIWALTTNTIFKNAKCQNMTSYWLGREFECYLERVPLKFVIRCHLRPLADIGDATDSFGLRCLR